MVSVNLVANTDLRTAEEFRQLVVKQDKGVVVRLGEIADVVLGRRELRPGRPLQRRDRDVHGHLGAPHRQLAGRDQAVRAALPEIQAQLPAGMKVGIPYDSTAYIQDAINEVLQTLTETLLIVVVVIFLFLGSFRSVLIPVVAIPISLIGAVFLMLVAGFTINLLTLLAIVLSVGLVVDDAIVMVENVERHLHMGKTPFQAAIDAARELVGPIIAMTITLAAVYAPVGIQGGLTGALFREFAFTLAGAVIVSGIVALTLSPMMGSKLLRAGDTERGFAGWSTGASSAFASSIHARSAGTLQYRPVVLVLWAIVVAADRAVLHVLAARTGAGRGPGRGVRRHPVLGELDDRSDQAVHQGGLRRLPLVPGEREHLPDHLPDRRLRRHGHQAVEPAEEDRAAASGRIRRAAVENPGHPRDSA